MFIMKSIDECYILLAKLDSLVFVSITGQERIYKFQMILIKLHCNLQWSSDKTRIELKIRYRRQSVSKVKMNNRN